MVRQEEVDFGNHIFQLPELLGFSSSFKHGFGLERAGKQILQLSGKASQLPPANGGSHQQRTRQCSTVNVIRMCSKEMAVCAMSAQMQRSQSAARNANVSPPWSCNGWSRPNSAERN
jgi:hypothetical protein